jgi:hypothetical protein
LESLFFRPLEPVKDGAIARLLDGRLSTPYGAAAQRLKSLTGSSGRKSCF